MAIEGKLVFLRPADGSGRLVFGDDSEVTTPTTDIGVDATFDGEPAGTLPSTVQLLWSANVSRGEAVKTRLHWQAAQPTRSLASSVRRSSSDSGCSTCTVARDSSAELTSNDGFSVVAPMKVNSPLSTCGKKASCWLLLKRCTSSTNMMVR